MKAIGPIFLVVSMTFSMVCAFWCAPVETSLYLFALYTLHRVVTRHFHRRYEKSHADGRRYPTCPCWGCDIRHRLAAHGFRSTQEAVSWKRTILTGFDNTWHDTPLREVPGCSCKQCIELRREARDARDAIEVVRSVPKKQDWMTGGWS